MSGYYLELSFNNRQEWFEVPLLPQSMEVSEGSNGSDSEVYGLGMINVIRSPKLAEFSFSGIFPAHPVPFVTPNALLPPVEYVLYLRKWLETKRPIRFIFTSTQYDINTPASIESFEWKEAAGAPGDIEYSLKLKQYRFYAARRLFIERLDDGTISSLRATWSRADDRAPLKVYTVQQGDTLWTISKKVFGTDQYWKEIQQYNRLTEAGTKELEPGQVLRIPLESGGMLD